MATIFITGANRGIGLELARLAAERGLKTIAFPAIGTGIAGFPMQECAEIMLREAAEHLRNGSSLETIYFVLFDDEAKETFERTRKRLQV